MMSSSELTTSNDDTNNINHSIDPLQIEEARRYQEIAERAERKAAERAATVEPSTFASSNNSNTTTKFLSKQEREKLALERLESKRQEVMTKNLQAEKDHNRFVSGLALEEKKKNEKIRAEMDLRERELRKAEENKESVEIDHEIKSIREHYLGQGEKKKKVNKPSDKFARIFQFDWKDEDDTARNDQNPLYNNRVKINTLFGRGYLAGIERQQQRKDSNFLVALSEKRMSEIKETDTGSAGRVETMERSQARFLASEALKRKFDEDVGSSSDKKDNLHWSEKQLHQMSERDWRIFREDFDIRVQGARDCLPLRNWEEARLPSQLLKAVRDANYEKPSPIQRQAIPVGMLKRDLIGLAETGSGKTAAFLIPLLAYLLAAPLEHIERVAGQGPLALIMAPTRELAQQIEEECIKLAKYTSFITANVVGGQSIEDQGFKLRKGVHIVIGTPGRLCDCLQNNYLVLNQCNYVVMDEADRMVDMGFEEQVLEVLDGMGSILKSENEDVAETQLSTQSIRITSMFSATMSSEIERLAKTYLRHPVIVKIGDEETGKNKRIEQRVMFLSEGQKKNKLIEELNKLGNQEKAIVFVNIKKQGDIVGRFLDGLGVKSGVLHGGRSQDQREDTLDKFRKGDVKVLVATDVAGRGLDIPDVTHVFNYDCPTKIVSYCHRIGRTGRAGKFGVAITFITDDDTEIMYSLKEYLESTNAAIPQQLARHPSAQAPLGSRDEKGNVVGQKRDSVKYTRI